MFFIITSKTLRRYDVVFFGRFTPTKYSYVFIFYETFALVNSEIYSRR